MAYTTPKILLLYQLLIHINSRQYTKQQYTKYHRHPTKPHYAKKVFNKLHPKDEFHSWQITNVFQLHGVVSGGGSIVDKKKSLMQ